MALTRRDGGVKGGIGRPCWEGGTKEVGAQNIFDILHSQKGPLVVQVPRHFFCFQRTSNFVVTNAHCCGGINFKNKGYTMYPMAHVMAQRSTWVKASVLHLKECAKGPYEYIKERLT